MNDRDIESLLKIISAAGDGVSLDEIEAQLTPPPPRRSLQRWLAELVQKRRVRVKGAARSTRYFVRPTGAISHPAFSADVPTVPPANPAKILSATVTQTVESTAEPERVTTHSGAQKRAERAEDRMRPVARTKALQVAFEEQLKFAIPEAVRRHVTVRSYAQYFRRLGMDYFGELEEEDRTTFVAMAMAEFRDLNDTTRVKYGIGPATLAQWRAESGFASAAP